MGYAEGKAILFDNRVVAPEPSNDLDGELPPTPVGRLGKHIDMWRTAMKQTTSLCTFTLSVIQSGYRLEWAKGNVEPEAAEIFCREQNHASTSEYSEFVTESIREGVRLGTMSEMDESNLLCVMALGVAIHPRTKKKRLIFDARHLNSFLHVQKFKMESLHVEGRTVFEGCTAGGTVDISSAYHHISMHVSARKYLGFSWNKKFYCFTVLPFGVATAPRVFTRVMKTCNIFMRQILGLLFFIFLDDFPFASRVMSESPTTGNMIVNTLSKFGWIVNLDKCVGLSTALPVFESLGHSINLPTQRFTLPSSKITMILDEIRTIKERPSVPANAVARVKGLVASTWLALGANARIRTRSLDKVIESRLDEGDKPTDRRTWKKKVKISAKAKAELEWLEKYLPPLGEQGRPFRENPVTMEVDGVAASDASDTGFGGWIALGKDSTLPECSKLIQNIQERDSTIRSITKAKRSAVEGLEIAGQLPENLLGTSSSLREIYGAFRIVECFAVLMQGGRFRLLMDNMSCVMALGGKVPYSATGGAEPKSVLGGSRVEEIQEWIIQLLDLAQEHNIGILAQWVPRSENERSDALSRISALEKFEYSINPYWFQKLEAKWGPHSIDAFATNENVTVQSKRFCSRFFNKDAEWTDAFSRRWSPMENVWAHPPPKFIGEAIAHIRLSGCSATLLVPMWKGASWWPILYPSGASSGTAAFISDAYVLGPARKVLEGSWAQESSNMSASLMMAFRFQGP